MNTTGYDTYLAGVDVVDGDCYMAGGRSLGSVTPFGRREFIGFRGWIGRRKRDGLRE